MCVELCQRCNELASIYFKTFFLPFCLTAYNIVAIYHFGNVCCGSHTNSIHSEAEFSAERHPNLHFCGCAL